MIQIRVLVPAELSREFDEVGCGINNQLAGALSMHFSSRLNLFLILGVAAISVILAMYQLVREVYTIRDDIQRQDLLLAESQRRTVQQILEGGALRNLQA